MTQCCVVQLEGAAKRQRLADEETNVLQVKASQIDAAKATVTADKRHRSRAETRVAKRPVAGGDALSAANKSTALTSDMGGQMVGLDKCLR